MSKIILFSVDGMRPDGMVEANTPVIDGLIARGAHTLSARTVMPSSTLPCHTSLFLGCRPERHGINTNTWTPPVRPIRGLIDVIHQAGHTTASFFNWEQLRDLSPPGLLNGSFFMNNCDEADGDRELANLAAHWLMDHDTTFAFVYLGYTDIAGHNHGWMSEPYIEGIANADGCIGTVLDAAANDCLVILTSDHGGHGQSHGTDCDEDMTTPVVIAGPGIPEGFTLEKQVHITDIAPTVTQHLGLQAPDDWIGEPII